MVMDDRSHARDWAEGKQRGHPFAVSAARGKTGEKAQRLGSAEVGSGLRRRPPCAACSPAALRSAVMIGMTGHMGVILSVAAAARLRHSGNKRCRTLQLFVRSPVSCHLATPPSWLLGGLQQHVEGKAKHYSFHICLSYKAISYNL